ncbi:MAG: hypothetical protein NTV06_09920 [candidate division Zixibacteria bacterium]|nr:hypothetical protein [candidate division Zixibacteria bacterium]
MGKVLMPPLIERRLKLMAFSTIGMVFLLTIGYRVVSTDASSMPLPAYKARNSFDFRLPENNICKGIRLNLKSGIAIDNATHRVLYCYNAEEVQSIASISKLLTAMVVVGLQWY